VRRGYVCAYQPILENAILRRLAICFGDEGIGGVLGSVSLSVSVSFLVYCLRIRTVECRPLSVNYRDGVDGGERRQAGLSMFDVRL